MKLNPDKRIRAEVLKKLKETKGYCPCVPPYLWNEDTRCKCKNMREKNICCCELYINDEKVK